MQTLALIIFKLEIPTLSQTIIRIQWWDFYTPFAISNRKIIYYANAKSPVQRLWIYDIIVIRHNITNNVREQQILLYRFGYMLRGRIPPTNRVSRLWQYNNIIMYRILYYVENNTILYGSHARFRSKQYDNNNIDCRTFWAVHSRESTRLIDYKIFYV